MELRDDRVLLRKLTRDDLPRMAMLANNEKIGRNLRDGFPYPYTLKDADYFYKLFTETPSLIVFAIEYNGDYVGNISLSLGQNVYRRSAEIGYFIGEDYWNKGIVTKAVKLITKYGFENLDINRIHTGIYEWNPASMKVLEKCGFQKEGVFKKSVIKCNMLIDEHRYALLKP
jgi:[ribosomal protein S5]-alanine N-acetyltransferase